MMKKRSKFSGVLVASLAAMFVTPALAEKNTFTTRLAGYEETPSTINSTGRGEFKATIGKDGTSIQYQLSYRDLSSTVTQSHIHFGRPALTGGIVLFLCTNLTPPAGVPTPQHCPPFPATISGTLTAADIIAVGAQGIDSGAAGFAEVVKAIRAGAAYANVHTTSHPSGEIRGPLGRPNDDEDDD